MTPEEHYNQWFFTAKHPATGFPYGTHLVYRVCDNDESRFQQAEEIMKAAFMAGYKAGAKA